MKTKWIALALVLFGFYVLRERICSAGTHSQTQIVSVRGIDSAGLTGLGSGQARLGSIQATIEVGHTSKGIHGGQLWIHEMEPSAALFTPYRLQFNAYVTEGIDVITNGCLRQIMTATSLADIVVLGDFVYEIRFYTPENVGDKTNGLYPVTGEPVAVWRIENPHATTNNINDVWVFHRNEARTIECRYQWDPVKRTWVLTTGGGAEYRREEVEYSYGFDGVHSNITTRFSYFDGDGRLVHSKSETTTAFPWGQNRTKEVLDPSGIAWTREWFYYTEQDVPSTNDLNYGKLRATRNSDGYWEIHSITKGDIRHATTRFTMKPYLNTPFEEASTNTAAVHIEEVRVYAYFKETRNFETIRGQVVSWRQHRLGESKGSDIVALDWDPQANKPVRTTERKWQVANTARIVGDVDKDGTVRRIERAEASPVPRTDTEELKTDVSREVFPSLFRRDRRRGVDEWATVVKTEVDDHERPIRIEYSDGTYETKEYGYHGLIAERSRKGLVTRYAFNVFDELESITRGEETERYVYDAMGRRIRTERKTGPVGEWILVHAIKYDVAGRVIGETDADGMEIRFEERLTPEGMKAKTTTYPTGKDKIEIYYPDGTLHEVNGTAVQPIRYLYGVETNRQFRTEIRLGSKGETNDWKRFWFDMIGRPYLIEHADGTLEPLIRNDVESP